MGHETETPTTSAKRFMKLKTDAEPNSRRVTSNVPLLDLCNNKITTAKYTLLTFLPKNLWEQFHKLANVYFLIIAIMQSIDAISISEGKPVILLPLLFVLTISAVKDAVEDHKRKKSDREENNRGVLVAVEGTFDTRKWRDLRVGDVVKIQEDEPFPADLILLNSSDIKGLCYVETKNLDGETNLKHKSSDKHLSKLISTDEEATHFEFEVNCELPNEKLYNFNGSALFVKRGESKKSQAPLNVDQLMLRGSSLRNTVFVYGLVVYTGHESKIMLNSTGAKAKQSQIEKTMNRQIIYIFIIQITLCIIGGVVYASWVMGNREDTDYFGWEEDKPRDNNWGVIFVIQLGTWMLIFTNFVPISLLVTLEVVKFCQAFFITWDEKVYHVENDLAAKVQSSNLNEELGQIQYVFSDKTGTLTCNIMEFKKISIGGITYGLTEFAESNNLAKKQGISNVAFYDPKFLAHLHEFDHPNCESIKKVLRLLSICHTVLVQEKDGKNVFQASSPDELALVNGALFLGSEFMGIDRDGFMKINFMGREENYELLNILEFTSTRKRMSVIVRSEDKTIKLLCKGADSIIIPRLNESNSQYVRVTNEHIEEYAVDGLRTLLLAEKTISSADYTEWNKRYQQAMNSILDRDEKCFLLAEEIETNMELLGATAIEDKLQPHVGATLAALKNTGIKVWVLTGDKIETAINIGFSCELLNYDMHQLVVDEETKEAVSKKLHEFCEKREHSKSKAALVISGHALFFALKDELASVLLELAQTCEVVIACRVSPKQKAEVVRLVRNRLKTVVTLAIGDGANDVNMITEAHIGVGIAGLEGQQAVRASDYAIGQFSFLKRLLFVHGREAYRRNSILVCYNFYKNVIFVIPHFWFAFVSAFSGQPLYDPWIYQFYNVAYTSLPIFLFSVFDRETQCLDDLEERQDLYQEGMNKKGFNTIVFWKWVLYAFIQAMYITIICFGALSVSGKDGSGQMDGFWAAGHVIYGAVVIIVNSKLLHFSLSHFWFTLLGVFLSILVYFLSLLVFSTLPHMDITGITEGIFKNPNTYLALLLCAGVSGMLDMIFWRHRCRIFDFSSEKNEESYSSAVSGVGHTTKIAVGEDKDQSFMSLNTNDILSQKRHTGFAFSQEAGHAPQLLEMCRGSILVQQVFSNLVSNSIHQLSIASSNKKTTEEDTYTNTGS